MHRRILWLIIGATVLVALNLVVSAMDGPSNPPGESYESGPNQ